jgi:hypothetical protein
MVRERYPSLNGAAVTCIHTIRPTWLTVSAEFARQQLMGHRRYGPALRRAPSSCCDLSERT